MKLLTLLAARAAAAEGAGEVFGTGSALAGFTTGPSDGTGPENVGLEGGVGADLTWRPVPSIDLGGGLRYDLAVGDDVHFLSAPFMVRVIVPLRNGERELRFGLGVGPAFALARVAGDVEPGDRYLHVFGPSLEGGFGYARRIGEGLDLVLHVGARFDHLAPLNARGYLAGSRLDHVQLILLRIGVGWR